MCNCLEGRQILLGVSGGIAAYKAADLASRLVKSGALVDVILTENATRFIAPLTFETITKRPCVTSTFSRKESFDVAHISLARKADAFVVAPATANVIAKFANGLADDMLTTTFLAATCKKILFPAMNTAMYENPATQENIQRLQNRGVFVSEPTSGRLACGDTGKGRLPETSQMYERIEALFSNQGDLTGRRVLITAGPTQEPMDPVRYITNHSTGKMGYALARAAAARGAEVTLISGPVSIQPPLGVRLILVSTAREMYEQVMANERGQDACILAAAVADYTPETVFSQKIKKGDEKRSLPLVRTPDILSALSSRKRPDCYLCGFSMETQELLARSKEKREKKGADMMVANSIAKEGSGFAADTNQAILLTEKRQEQLPLMSKAELSDQILDWIREEAGWKS